MSTPQRRRRIVVEEFGEVTVVRFVDRKILDEQNIDMVKAELYPLTDEPGRRKLVLDFGNVEFFSSTALGMVIRVHQVLHRAGGRVAYSGIHHGILEVFQLTKLDRMLTIIPAWENAVRWFEGGAVVTLVGCPLVGCGGRLRIPGDRVVEGGTCPDCRAEVGYRGLMAPPACGVWRFQCATYEGECVRAEVTRFGERGSTTGWVVSMSGRLDLFASEELERVWRTVPEPRRVVCDLSAVSEVSAAGGEVLAGLLTAAEGVLLASPAGGLPAGVTLPEHVTPSANTDPVEWLGGHGPVPALTVLVTLER